MFKNSLTNLFVLVGIAAMAITSPARASTTETDSHGDLQNAFDSLILNNDLINTSQPSLSSASQSLPTVVNGGSVADSNDGSTTPTLTFGGDTGLEFVAAGTTFTYQLNLNPGTGGSASGYTITGVHFINGWSTPLSFADQKWDLQIATLANPTFTTVWSVNYQPSAYQATMVSLAGDIGTGVTGVQFVTSNPISSVLREIDVLGAASPTPEPASLGLLAAGSMLLLRRRRQG